jgi:hypothetical protein
MEQAIATAPAPPRRDSGEAGIRKVIRTAWRNRGAVALGVAGLILIAASITMMALTAPHLSAKAGAVDIASTMRCDVHWLEQHADVVVWCIMYVW